MLLLSLVLVDSALASIIGQMKGIFVCDTKDTYSQAVDMIRQQNWNAVDRLVLSGRCTQISKGDVVVENVTNLTGLVRVHPRGKTASWWASTEEVRGNTDTAACIWKYGQPCPLSLAGRSRYTWRCVRNGIDLAITEVQALHLFKVEGTGTYPPKDAHLVTAFIHCTVPVETFRDRQRWFMGVIRGNQLWSGTRAKTLIPWGAFRRSELQHPQTIAPIGYVDKETGVCEAHFHTAGIVDLPICVIDLVEHRRFGTLNINDHHPCLPAAMYA